MDNYLNEVYWNNTLLAWLIAGGIIVLAAVVIRLFSFFVLRRLQHWSLKTKTSWDNFLVEQVRRSVVPALYVAVIYFALKTLKWPVQLSNALHVAYLAVITFFILRVISAAFKKVVYSYINNQENSNGKEKQAGGLIIIVNIIIWILGIIFFIDNLGYNVTTLIAGLGIGGIAIALAAQAILGDLFSYFVIFFDKPFEIGDFVTVDDKAGTIEYIGIKTTRIKTLSGEQLICSNTDLTNSRLHNFKRLERRRIVFSLGVTYQTTHQQLMQIPAIVKDIISSKEMVLFDRGHFSGYGDSSLNFEFVYFVLHSDYTVYMDKQQAIYLDIFAAFEANRIEFAYPTQTIYMQSLNS